MGSVIKRENDFAIRFEGPKVMGKRSRPFISGFKTEKEAARALILAEENVKSFNAGNYTFAQIKDIWIEDHVSVNLSPKTQEFYEELLEELILPNIGKMKLRAITPKDIKALYKKLKKQGYSDDKIKKVHTVIRAIFYKAYEWELNDEKIMDKVKIPKQKKPEHEYWSSEEIKKALEVLQGYSLIFHIKVAVNLGLREGEVCGLKEDDIDFKNKELKISRAIQYIKDAYKYEGNPHVQEIRGDIIIKDPKSDTSARTLPLTDEMAQVFKRRIVEIKKNKIAIGNKYDNEWDGFLSVNPDGTLINDRRVSKRFSEKIKRVTELKRITFHELRHSCASWLLDCGADMKTIQEILGHSDMSITSEIYAHLNEEKKRSAFEAMQKAK